jgi:long-subunit fatty acid transport protein
MIKLILASLFVTSSFLFSQTYEVEDFIMSSAGDLYSLNYLNGESNGSGNAGIGATRDISGALLNPGSFRINKGSQAGLLYTYKTSQKWHVSNIVGDYSYETRHQFPSVFAAFGKKLGKNLSLGFIYTNPAGLKTDFAGFVSTGGDDLYYEYNVHSFNIPVSYNFGMVSAGLNLNFSYHRNFIHGVSTISEPDRSRDAVNTFSRFNIQAGLLFTPSGIFSAGVTFIPGFKAYPESDIEEVSPNIKVVSKFPMRVGAGIKYTAIKNKLNLYLDYNFVQTSELKGYKDRHDFNFGGDIIVNKNITLRAGAFSFFDNRNFEQSTVTFPHPEGEHEQIFLTCGATANFNDFKITGSVMDSHISKGFVKLTYINLGTVVNF